MTFAERRIIQETARLCAELAERVQALEAAAKPRKRKETTDASKSLVA